jgi:hypothetical protein
MITVSFFFTLTLSVIILIPLFFGSTDTICIQVDICHFAAILLGFFYWHFHILSTHQFGNFRLVYFIVGKTLKITFLRICKKFSLRSNITDFNEDHARDTPNVLCDTVCFFQNVLKLPSSLMSTEKASPIELFCWHNHVLIHWLYHGCDRG